MSTGETTQVITFTATEDANVTAFFKPGGSGQIYNSVVAQANDASLFSHRHRYLLAGQRDYD